MLRLGLYCWAFLGLAGTFWVLSQAFGELTIVVVPLILALFPAAVLAPLSLRMVARGLPPALAALVTLFGAFALIAAVIALIAPSVSAQFGDLGAQVQQGADRAIAFIESGPFGLPQVSIEELIARGREQLSGVSTDGLGSGILGAVRAVTEGVAGVLFGLVALFFYLKDGPRMARWLRNLFPERMQGDAEVVGVQVWQTIGAYIRGQLLIAVADAVMIGIGILVLGVPLALPLILLVFVGGLFPIVGAIVAGLVAVLVALATVGPVKALILLGVILAVQEIEGDVLAPIVLGRATQLHPLATLAALTAGAVLLGFLGAFLAIPVTASLTRALSHLRSRRRERQRQPAPGDGAVSAAVATEG